MTTDPFASLAAHVRDPSCGFSLGIFGAIAEFVRAPDEAAELREGAAGIEIATDRGALRIARHPDTVLVDYEMPSRHAERRIPARAACLPEAAVGRFGNGAVTALGADGEAVRSGDRDALLFDLGFGLHTTRTCVRTRVRELIAALSAAEGVGAFAAPGLMAAILAHGPHRVFVSPLGRIEVFQPIPPPDGQSPDGPHTHVLPKLMAHGRTHAASVPIPDGLLPCLSVHPPR